MSAGRNQSLAPGGLTRSEWAKRLNDQWDNIRTDAVEGFIALGRDLHAAKADLGKHGLWMGLVKEDLKFNQRVANMFMRIAAWSDQNRGIASNLPKLLPPDYTTVDKLTRLEQPILRRLIEDGTICPTLPRNLVAKILRLERVKADEQRVLALRPVAGKFRTIVIDPAWEYNQSIAGRAKPDYALQTLEQLRQLDVRAWADREAGCHLYICATNAFMPHACELEALWGFEHHTIITWIKPPPFGLGKYFRNSTEHVLFATLGDSTTRPAAASIPTHFEAPRGAHSEKPEKLYDIVRAASYPPYGEAFQRKARPDFVNLFRETEIADADRSRARATRNAIRRQLDSEIPAEAVS